MMMTSLLKCQWPVLSHDDTDADDSNDVMNDWKSARIMSLGQSDDHGIG